MEFLLEVLILLAKLQELAEQVVVVMDQEDQQMEHLELTEQAAAVVELDILQHMVQAVLAVKAL